MKFQDLPVSIQEIAAKTLSEMMLRPDDKKEPAELAQKVKSAFTELLSDSQSGTKERLASYISSALHYIDEKTSKESLKPESDPSMKHLYILRQLLTGSGECC